MKPKKFIAWHVTQNIASVLHDRFVIPKRMKCVYLLRSWRDVNYYAREFGGNGAVKVEVNRSDIANRWKAAYAPCGVIRLKLGATAKVIREIKLRRKELTP